MARRERFKHGGVNPAWIRRNKLGQIVEVDLIRKSQPVDRAKKAKRVVPPGQGDKGDQKRK